MLPTLFICLAAGGSDAGPQACRIAAMVQYGPEQRAAAVAVWLKFKNTSRQALKEFYKTCPHPQPRGAARFIKDWGKHWVKSHDLSDKPGRGRKSKVDPALVQQAVEIFASGYQVQGCIHHWPNFEVAARLDEQLAQLVRRSGVSPRTFFHHMLQARMPAAHLTAICCTLRSSRHTETAAGRLPAPPGRP